MQSVMQILPSIIARESFLPPTRVFNFDIIIDFTSMHFAIFPISFRLSDADAPPTHDV